MKYATTLILALLFVATSAFAADFAPTKLVLDAAPMIEYDFGGNALDISVQVTGVPAMATFMVYTKDMASQIGAVHNGYLGWHYVNHIDTCIYMSDRTQLDIGKNTISWSGLDNDGNAVPAGAYTYYVWAYDNISQRYIACSSFTPGQNAQILEKGEDGSPLANPVYINGARRWTLGNDPQDTNMLETTGIGAPAGWGAKNHYVVQPDDWSYIYYPMHNKDASTGGIWKYKWVPNGDAELESGWGENGAVTWTQPQFYHMNAATDGNYIYATANTYKEDYVHNELWVVTFDGEFEIEMDIAEFWGDPDDAEMGAQMNGGPGTMTARDNLLFLGCHCSCLRQVLYPMRGLEDEEQLVYYVNGNGDWVLDHNFDETADKPWVCNDFNVGPYTYTYYSDAEYFGICPAYDMGAVSFGLLGPDGTGIDYFAFAGETANQKTGLLVCDNGSAFDGLYCSMNEAIGSDGKTSTFPETYFAGHDVIRGVITNQVAVDDAPAAFAVDQNSPNPFNPTTTIGFTIPEAGNVAIDVFNVAGQKVDTIASDYMSAGSHSVTWDASGFSAGVYFYTVKAGDFSRTVKMTLVK